MRLPTLLAALILPLPATEILYDAFESDGFGEWAIEGQAFGKSPTASSPKGMNGKVQKYANSYYVSSAHDGDASTGSLTSQSFKIQLPYIAFLVSGGNHKDTTAVQLLIDGKVVLTASGQNSLEMRQVVWDVQEFAGKEGQLRILDSEKGGWGIINVDHILFTDTDKPKFPAPTTKDAPKTDGLVASDVLPGLTVPEGSVVTMFGENEDLGIYSPTALSVDEKGHVYVSETHRFRYGVEDNRDHLYWLMDDISSQTTDDRVAMHEKWKEKLPLEKLTTVSEKIRVLIDTDGDGKADKSEVFADNFKDLLDGTAAGIMAFEGKIYFACIPSIWMLEDKDGDLKADERKVLQDGFGVRVSFSGHDLNGFALGPDGRIYTTIGDRGFSFTTKEGREYKFPNQGAILRFEPDGSEFEVVHTGLRNPKEIAFDQYGTAISVDNNSDQGDQARVVFMLEGADSGWRMGHQVLNSFHKTAGMENRPINQWMQEKMWAPQNDSQPGYIVPPMMNLSSGPSGLAYYPGTGYALNSENKFLICDYRGSAAASGIWSFGIEPDGAGFSVSDSSKFTWGVAATDIEWGYDGKVYVADFVTGWESHKAGRVFTLGQTNSRNDVAEIIAAGFTELSIQRLADLLTHKDQRVRLRAQYEIAKRPEALPIFTAASNQTQNELERLHGIWGLGMLARVQKSESAVDFLSQLLNNPDALVRGQAAQALGESPLETAGPLIPLLADESPRVRALAAISIGRKKDPSAISALIQMISENNDESPVIRHAGVMGLLGSTTPEYLGGLVRHESAAVRRAAVITLRRMRSDQIVGYLGDSDLSIVDEAIRAIHDTGMENVRPAVAALLDDATLGTDDRPITRMMLRRLVHSAFRIGNDTNMLRVIKVAANPKLDLDERKEALRLLSLWATPHVVDQSTGKHSPLPNRDPELAKATLAANISLLSNAGPDILSDTMALAIQYKIKDGSLDTGMLTRIIRDEKSDGTTRAGALKLFLQSNPDNLQEILTEAAKSNDDTLATSALALASGRDPAANVAALKGALNSSSSKRRQVAWGIVAGLPAEHAVPLLRDGLVDLTAGKGDPASDFDLLAAAQKREEPAIKASLKAYQDSLPTDDPLARWSTTLAGGNAENGFKIFQSHGAAQCMRCHQHESGHTEGGSAGPNLLGVALRHDARGLLESLMLPNAKIANGFGTATLELKNGTTKGGIIIAETDTTLDLREGEKDVWRINKADLKEMPHPISGMLPMETILSPQEVRDVIAWLLTLTKENVEKAPSYEVKPLSMSTKTEMPATQPTQPTTEVSEEIKIDPAVMELGKQQYILCAACHGPTGDGVPNLAPPLANSEWVNGPADNLVRIQFRGLSGPITVAGQEYNLPVPMMAMGAGQSDENVAAVLTYIRNSFGNSAPAVTPEFVAKFRDEIGKPPLTVKDLIDPHATTPAAETKPAGEEMPAEEKTDAAVTPAETTPPAAEVEAGAQIDPATMQLGEQQYILCGACHGPTGAGVAGMAPPLANSEWVTGPYENLIGIQLRGLSGPITVNGKDYNLPAPMAAMGAGQPDENIAAVLTYIRNSFGNSAPAVTPEMVADYRAANKDILSQNPVPVLETKDLLPPVSEIVGDAPLATIPSGGLGAPGYGIAIVLVVTVLSLLASLRMKVANK
ncbi:PVC-type heme-binding CxxCH protein [Verrucomicrobiaceae bacterium 227]